MLFRCNVFESRICSFASSFVNLVITVRMLETSGDATPATVHARDVCGSGGEIHKGSTAMRTLAYLDKESSARVRSYLEVFVGDQVLPRLNVACQGSRRTG